MLLVKKIKESPARVEAAKQTIRNLGGEVKGHCRAWLRSHPDPSTL
jgi:uncharacterized protein with GYD domain